MSDFEHRQAIGALIQNWGFWRDQARWDELRTTFHPDGNISVSWFSGLFNDFVAASVEMRKRRSGSKHWIGGSLIKVAGDRALAETNVMIMGRSHIHEVEVDTVAYARFFDLVERRAGAWRMLKRAAIYEKDRVDPVVAGARVPFDQARLDSFPRPYRHLAYSLTSQVFAVSPDLPTDGSPALERLYAHGTNWLAGEVGT